MKYLKHQLVERSERQKRRLDEALGKALLGLGAKALTGWAGSKVKKGVKSWWAGTEANPEGGIAQTLKRQSHPIKRDAKGKKPQRHVPMELEEPGGKKVKEKKVHRARDTSRTSLAHKGLTAAGELLATWEKPATGAVGLAHSGRRPRRLPGEGAGEGEGDEDNRLDPSKPKRKWGPGRGGRFHIS